MRRVFTVCVLVSGVVWNARMGGAQTAPPEVELPDITPLVSTEREGGGAEDPLGIEESLRASVYTVAKRPQLLRESPGVVTVVTRDDILAAGARDLIDVLRLVPGFGFGVDVQGVVGVAFRGNWGHEGKVLVLVDGHEMNEIGYSTFSFGGHVPAELIDRVEIIRGPGSVIYGGNAELAVINVVTRRIDSGGSVTARYGQMVGGTGTPEHRRLSLSAGHSTGDLSVSLNGVLGEGRRSDGTFTDVTGASYELEDQAETNPRWLSMDLAFRQLRVRFLYDGHEITSRDGFGEMSARADRMEFGALYGSAQYALEIGDRVTVTPRLSYKRQTSWRVVDETSDYYFDKIYERMVAAALVEYDVSRHVSVLSGLELTLDRGRLADESLADVGLNSSFGGESEVTYEDVAVYSQLGLSHRIANVTLGARYELHSQVGGSFVPRVGVTRVFGDFHVKVLASSAFRAPSVENLNLNPDLAPERTIAFEIETGMKLGDHAFIGANAFDVTIHDPIVYAVVDGEEAYFNFDRSGTRGVEIELRLRYPWGTVDASGSLATANGKNNVPLYQVPDDDDRMLGMPLYKLAASAALRPHRSFTIAPSLIVLGPHAAYHQVDVDGNALLRRSDATVLANLFLSWRVPGVKGLEIGAGVANAFDAPEEFPQPYDGGHPPLPGRSRTVFGRVSWDVGF